MALGHITCALEVAESISTTSLLWVPTNILPYGIKLNIKQYYACMYDINK